MKRWMDTFMKLPLPEYLQVGKKEPLTSINRNKKANLKLCTQDPPGEKFHYTLDKRQLAWNITSGHLPGLLLLAGLKAHWYSCLLFYSNFCVTSEVCWFIFCPSNVWVGPTVKQHILYLVFLPPFPLLALHQVLRIWYPWRWRGRSCVLRYSVCARGTSDWETSWRGPSGSCRPVSKEWQGWRRRGGTWNLWAALGTMTTITKTTTFHP